MKKIIIVLGVMLFALQLKAQLVYDKYGNIIPFSWAEEYKTEIEEYEVPEYVIPYMNNDSLCRKYNDGKAIKELEDRFIDGINLHVKPISLKENGVGIKLKHGTLWRYAIGGTSVRTIGVNLGFPKLPKGSYIAFVAADTTVSLIQHPRVYYQGSLMERHKTRGLSEGIFGNKLIIEYYEPDSLKEKDNIIIKSITYGFVGYGNLGKSSYNEPELKSGYWGDSSFPTCQKDVICSDVGSYLNEAKSVVFLNMVCNIDEDDNGFFETTLRIKGTGFFLNKVGGYGNNDSPILVTAGHSYHYLKLGITPIDLINNITNFYVVTKYQNLKCGTDDLGKGGIRLPGDFNRIALGSSYDDFDLPWYSPNNDYAVLQASSTVNGLSSYDLVYGAWSKYHNFNTGVGYFCIHHPKGDVKKINKDNDAVYRVTTDGFDLKYDIGITEGGSSGAPIFNSSKQIVGFHVASDENKSCNLIGQMISICGTFSNVYYEFYSILDSTGAGSAQSSNPQPPSYSELPSHCSNCKQDYDETGIDCGGSCYPCGMQDVLTIKTDLDLLGSVKSRYEIFAEPDLGTLLALKSGSSSLEAGQNIYLNGGFEVQKGATFYAGIDAELMSEADRGCQPACVPDLPNIFTPNGDGMHDYWSFSQTFVTSYDLLIWDENGKIVYSVNNRPVYENGVVYAWDGAGTVSGHMYFGVLTYTDCYGNAHEKEFFTHLYKSATINTDDSVKVAFNQNVDDRKVEINYGLIVYPNPFTEKVVITYSGKDFPITVKLIDLNGKEIINKEIYNRREALDLSKVNSGVYIINAKAGEYNLVQKLIKE